VTSEAPLHDRDGAAEHRDRTSAANDETAAGRDARSDARDVRAEAREKTRRVDPEAASDRASAKRDRQRSAGDRRHAEDDREAARSDRADAARERTEQLVDGLTGVHRRESGLLELEREVTKAHRTHKSFVLAFVDVDDLKARNDSQGHAAGDRLLLQVVETVRGVVRDYDLIVRYGGDEFLCGLADVGLAEARRRFEAANASLAATLGASITAGLAELAPEELLEDLIGRADADMYAQRHNRSAE
jgi:diguanylate cyclase (GGDEF)-like protein